MLNTITFDNVVQQVKYLSPEEQIRLIQQVAVMLEPVIQAKPSYMLVYGKYKGERESTEEDFKLAEWHPSEDDLDGL